MSHIITDMSVKPHIMTGMFTLIWAEQVSIRTLKAIFIILKALPHMRMVMFIITPIIQVLQYISGDDIIIIMSGKPKSQTGTDIVFQGEHQSIGSKYPWNKVKLISDQIYPKYMDLVFCYILC